MKDRTRLVLTRTEGEDLLIGEGAGQVRIRVQEIRHGRHGRQVRLAIEAPHDTPIFRREVWDQIQKQRALATIPGSR